MKLILILILIANSFLLALDTKVNDKKRKDIVKKNIEKQMQKEKKFSKEQTFYQSKNYDLKGAQVNKDSLDSVPNIEPQYDFDMDSVYD